MAEAGTEVVEVASMEAVEGASTAAVVGGISQGAGIFQVEV
jgi:hypothetical protein